MTPLAEPTTPAENLYNESHIRTRNTVERQYGVWKRRFPVLRLELRVKLELIPTHIVATAVLHNMAIDNNDALPENADYVENPDQDIYFADNDLTTGNLMRRRLIEEYFSTLLNH